MQGKASAEIRDARVWMDFHSASFFENHFIHPAIFDSSSVPFFSARVFII
jgi:hypothetical protein